MWSVGVAARGVASCVRFLEVRWSRGVNQGRNRARPGSYGRRKSGGLRSRLAWPFARPGAGVGAGAAANPAAGFHRIPTHCSRSGSVFPQASGNWSPGLRTRPAFATERGIEVARGVCVRSRNSRAGVRWVGGAVRATSGAKRGRKLGRKRRGTKAARGNSATPAGVVLRVFCGSSRRARVSLLVSA